MKQTNIQKTQNKTKRQNTTKPKQNKTVLLKCQYSSERAGKAETQTCNQWAKGVSSLTRMGASFFKEVSQFLMFKPNLQTRSLSKVNSAYLTKDPFELTVLICDDNDRFTDISTSLWSRGKHCDAVVGVFIESWQRCLSCWSRDKLSLCSAIRFQCCVGNCVT